MGSLTEFIGADDGNFQTDEEILLSILPSNVWANTFQKLVDKHPPTVENLSNSSLYFRNLLLSKRVLYLFPQVFKLIGPEFANQLTTQVDGSSIIRSRTICKQWNKSVDQFIIDGTLEPDFFNTEPIRPSQNHALENARYQYFGEVKPTKLPQFLSHFEETHLPQSSRNPFIGNKIYIDLTGYTEQIQWPSIADQVSTLLRKYGHHIKILHIGLFKYQQDTDAQLRNQSWLLEWLENCPNLTHLKVSEKFHLSLEHNKNTDTAFGYCPHPELTNIERLGLEMIGPLMNARLQRSTNYSDSLEEKLNSIRNSSQKDSDVSERCYGAIQEHTNSFDNGTGPVRQPILLRFPTLENLQCLKLCQLSALNFNSLITANTHVGWLHIESLGEEKHKYVDYHALEFPNLRKLYMKLCSSVEVRKFNSLHESWLKLTHLEFQYCSSKLCCFSTTFTEWVEIFGVISKNWGTTLTDLKLKLPIADMDFQKVKVLRDSVECRLYLPTLKRLKIWLGDRSGEAVVKTEFLELMKENLEELIIE